MKIGSGRRHEYRDIPNFHLFLINNGKKTGMDNPTNDGSSIRRVLDIDVPEKDRLVLDYGGEKLIYD